MVLNILNVFNIPAGSASGPSNCLDKSLISGIGNAIRCHVDNRLKLP